MLFISHGVANKIKSTILIVRIKYVTIKFIVVVIDCILNCILNLFSLLRFVLLLYKIGIKLENFFIDKFVLLIQE